MVANVSCAVPAMSVGDEDDYRHVGVGTEAECRRTGGSLGEVIQNSYRINLCELSPGEPGRFVQCRFVACDHNFTVEFCDWEPRPRVRADCPTDGPCPYVGCRYHLANDETPLETEDGVVGKTKIASGFIMIERNCALDFVDNNPGGATLDAVGEEMLLTRERIRQIEVQALGKLKHSSIFWEFVDLGLQEKIGSGNDK